MTVRAVIFDFGGVLVPSPLDVFAGYERAHGLEVGAISRCVVRRGEAGAWSRLERGELDLSAFAAAFGEELREDGLEVDVGELMRRIGALELRPEMLEAVRRTHERAKTGLLTNNWREEGMGGVIARLEGLFDVVVESYKERVRKPDPRIYGLACERLGVAPAEAVFLDDLGGNLKAARALGLTTIKVGDPAAAIAELERVLDERGATR